MNILDDRNFSSLNVFTFLLGNKNRTSLNHPPIPKPWWHVAVSQDPHCVPHRSAGATKLPPKWKLFGCFAFWEPAWQGNHSSTWCNWCFRGQILTPSTGPRDPGRVLTVESPIPFLNILSTFHFRELGSLSRLREKNMTYFTQIWEDSLRKSHRDADCLVTETG